MWPRPQTRDAEETGANGSGLERITEVEMMSRPSSQQHKSASCQQSHDASESPLKDTKRVQDEEVLTF